MLRSRLPIALLLAAALTGSCEREVSPTEPTASPPVPVFAPGDYTLTLSTPGTPPPGPPGSPGFNPFVCISVGGGGPASATLDVTVDAQGTRFSARTTNGSLLLSVEQVGPVIGGELIGAATNPAAGVSLSVQPRPGDTAIPLSGTVTSAHTMSGFADGQVQFSGSAGSYGCNSADWSLSPR